MALFLSSFLKADASFLIVSTGSFANAMSSLSFATSTPWLVSSRVFFFSYPLAWSLIAAISTFYFFIQTCNNLQILYSQRLRCLLYMYKFDGIFFTPASPRITWRPPWFWHSLSNLWTAYKECKKLFSNKTNHFWLINNIKLKSKRTPLPAHYTAPPQPPPAPDRGATCALH